MNHFSLYSLRGRTSFCLPRHGHSGNSGGPVFDNKGNVIGVARGGIASFQNTNFAIKASIVKNFLEASGIFLIEPKPKKLDQRKFSYQIQKSVVLIECES